MNQKQATLELGTKPVGRLLWQYALPAVIAMLASSAYNIIDRIFIGQIVGPEAIAGLAITFPFMNLLGAFGACIGVGASTAISIRLGQKDYETAGRLFGNNASLNVLAGVTLAIIGLLFLDPILRFFGASDVTLPYAHQFMVIILLGNVFTHLYFGQNAVLRSVGKPRQAMIATLLTVFLNIALDVVFIVWLRWGIQGGALATVLSQFTALCWQVKLLSKKDEIVHFKRGIYKLHSNLVKQILSIGISPFLMNACSCIIVIFVNKQLVAYGGDMAVGAYGIANSVATVFIMFVIGMNQGMQPIAGYNYGARHDDRLMRVLNLTIVCATVIMTIGWVIGMFAPRATARLFTTDATLMSDSVVAIRYVMFCFPIIGFQMVVASFFQCIGKVKISIFLSLSRQLIILLPLLALLPLWYQLDGVWISMPVSDALASIMAFVVMVYNVRTWKHPKKAERE